MRWLFCDTKPEKDLLFGYHRADEVRRQFLIPLWNVYAFLVTYARIDGWMPGARNGGAPSLLDRWILARLNETVGEVTDRLEAYEPNLATAALTRFLDDLSNWYLRRSRRRFWAKAGLDEGSDADKAAAYATLYAALTTIIRLLAPFVPFVTEAIYQNLVRGVWPDAPTSVHHSEWPTVDRAALDPGLTSEMALVLGLVSLGHAARNKAGRKVRQPLAEAAFAVATPEERRSVGKYADLIADELNVKSVRLLDSATEAVDFRLNPFPRQLGQKYGSRFPAIRAALLELEPTEAASRLLSGDPVRVRVEGEEIEVLPEEVEVQVEPHPGLVAAADGPYLAALRTALTPELESEGLAREAVRRIQDLRKEAGLNVDDRILVEFAASERLARALVHFREYVMAETLARALDSAFEPTGVTKSEHEFEGETLRIAITKAAGQPDQST
jgi:isoleucyl-tRNA synthetase